LTFLLVGCAEIPSSGGSVGTGRLHEDAEHLARDLVQIDPSISSEDAVSAALVALKETQALRKQFRPITPAILNNCLVNLRLKDGGLCYHWAGQIYVALADRRFKTLDIHWGLTNRGNKWREHNVVVVSAHGRRFEDGILLDAWRFGGRLLWMPVGKDATYGWEEVGGVELAYRIEASKRL
jgi:hypothetical protein